MKKLLLLGGSAPQVIAIKTAKRLGYYTVLCDFLPDNPGQYHADKFYLVSTTDKEAVLKVAQEEQIHGIVAYSSDPAAPTAAYVSEKMGLPGIPYHTAESFCEKHLFRAFLKNNGFNVPWSMEITADTDASALENLQLPAIVKPTDSSGSKGVTVIRHAHEFAAARDYALQFSRNNIAIAEEFIERDHPDVIEAEIFVVNGEVTVWGLMSSVRDNYTNPLLPATYCYPIRLSPQRVEMVKSEVSRLVRCCHARYGAFNIEMVITKSERLYFLDAGPRNGGNMLPEYIGGIMKQDLVEATIYSAMGDFEKLNGLKLDGTEGGYWGLVVLHTDRRGIFKHIAYSDVAKKCLLREHLLFEPGTVVHPFITSRDAVGLAFFCFPSEEIRNDVVDDFVGKHIKVVVEELQ